MGLFASSLIAFAMIIAFIIEAEDICSLPTFPFCYVFEIFIFFMSFFLVDIEI